LDDGNKPPSSINRQAVEEEEEEVNWEAKMAGGLNQIQ